MGLAMTMMVGWSVEHTAVCTGQDAGGVVLALKDGVTLPLVADLCRAAHVAVPFGLLSLPSELRISVMELLSVRHRQQRR
jgi:hypothetical protein